MASAKLPQFLWGECVHYATYLHNRLPHSMLKFITPYEARFGKAPNIKELVPFGQRCMVHLKSAPKISACRVICHWVGPDEQSLGHCIYWPSQHKVSVEHNLKFINLHDDTTVEPPEALMENSPSAEEEHSTEEEYHSPPHPDSYLDSGTPAPKTPKCSCKPSCQACGIEYNEHLAVEEEMPQPKVPFVAQVWVLLASKVLADVRDLAVIIDVNK